jgi:hypothetical protein
MDNYLTSHYEGHLASGGENRYTYRKITYFAFNITLIMIQYNINIFIPNTLFKGLAYPQDHHRVHKVYLKFRYIHEQFWHVTFNFGKYICSGPTVSSDLSSYYRDDL